jgi:hypothetical protein
MRWYRKSAEQGSGIMGGLGSMRWGWSSTKDTVESAR